MKLENIGFYTLSDYRASQTSVNSPLWRCELILTHRCNFRCVYCRGLRDDCRGDIQLIDALDIIDLWASQGLKNIRFSGGEPTLYPDLKELIHKCKFHKMEHIAISTNGSNFLKYYQDLIKEGVNDFSISLDSGCCSVGDVMAGGIKNSWNKVTDNIKSLAKETYVTLGMVFNEFNINDCLESVLYADSLGVSDIRVIPSAQYNHALNRLSNLPESILNKYPILKYRINNIKNGISVRGIQDKDTHKCYLALDDMAIAGKYHFPCIIYMREMGNPIGKINPNLRYEREDWVNKHDTHLDNICKGNCLDVCVSYNNKVESFRKQSH